MSFVPSNWKDAVRVLRFECKTYVFENQANGSIVENYLELGLRFQSFDLESLCIQSLEGKHAIDLRCYRVIEFEDAHYLIGKSEKRLLTKQELLLNIPIGKESNSSGREFRIAFLNKNHQTKYIAL